MQDGIEFFFFEWISGELTPLKWMEYRNKRCKAEGLGESDVPDDMKKWIDQLAEINIRLLEISFDRIGSLTLGSSTDKLDDKPQIVVGPLIDEGTFMDRAREGQAALSKFGSFRTNAERYLAIIDWVLEDVERNCKPGGAKTYLLHLWLRQHIAASPELNAEEEYYHILHGEPKGDHIKLDENGGITGLLDWEL